MNEGNIEQRSGAQGEPSPTKGDAALVILSGVAAVLLIYKGLVSLLASAGAVWLIVLFPLSKRFVCSYSRVGRWLIWGALIVPGAVAFAVGRSSLPIERRGPLIWESSEDFFFYMGCLLLGMVTDGLLRRWDARRVSNN